MSAKYKTAKSAYAERKAEIEANIAKLQELVARHEANFEKYGAKSWGYAGDIALAAERLAQAVEAVSGVNLNPLDTR